MEKLSPYHPEIANLNPDDSTAICGWEPKKAKLACAFREGGVANSLPSQLQPILGVGELMHAEVGRKHFAQSDTYP